MDLQFIYIWNTSTSFQLKRHQQIHKSKEISKSLKAAAVFEHIQIGQRYLKLQVNIPLFLRTQLQTSCISDTGLLPLAADFKKVTNKLLDSLQDESLLSLNQILSSLKFKQVSVCYKKETYHVYLLLNGTYRLQGRVLGFFESRKRISFPPGIKACSTSLTVNTVHLPCKPGIISPIH